RMGLVAGPILFVPLVDGRPDVQVGRIANDVAVGPGDAPPNSLSRLQSQPAAGRGPRDYRNPSFPLVRPAPWHTPNAQANHCESPLFERLNLSLRRPYSATICAAHNGPQRGRACRITNQRTA